MEGALKILFVEDVRGDAELLWYELKKNGIIFEKLLVDNNKEYLEGLSSLNPDLIISDYSLPQFDGMKALLIRNERAPFVPFIMVTGSINEEVAVECLKAGADDYILKENLSRLGPAVINSLKKKQILQEKNLTENALRESEEKFRLLTENSVMGIFVTQDSKLVYVNQSFADLFKYSREEIINKLTPKDLIHPDDLNFVTDRIKDRLQAKNERDSTVYRAFSKEGSLIYVEVYGILISYSGRPAVMGTMMDVTERKKAEETLRESEKKYRNIFENVQDVYYETSMEGTLLEVSPSIEYLSKGQYHSEDLTGTSMLDFYALPEERQLVISELLVKGTITDFEINLRNRDGSIIACSISAKVIFSPQGNPEKIIGSMRDISRRKGAEEALQNSLTFSESLLKTIPFGMHIVDEKGNILFLSDKFKSLFGNETSHKKCWEIYRDDKLQPIDCPLNNGIRPGETNVCVFDAVFGNRTFEISHTGMMYQGKKAMLEIFQDITERKEKEKELISSKVKAEESDKLKTAFLHNISHEIRTPMNAIVGFSALLSEPGMDSETQKSFIEIIMESSNHLLGIVSDILEISNIEAGIIKVNNKEVQLNYIMKSLYDQFILKTAEKNIKLEFSVPLPDREATILVDNIKLVQVLSNLIGNAFKFSNSGKVAFGYKLKDDFLEFFVSDSGIGIPENLHNRIFDRFYQVESTVTRQFDGTGLGLSISKAFIEKLGGKIWLTSQQGKGSVFYFTVPYLMADYVNIAPRVTGKAEKELLPGKKRILIAEDEENNFLLIKELLSSLNVELIHVQNGKKAVDFCESDQKINLVLMDIKMPVMDGYSATKEIRKFLPDLPVIALTAYAFESDREKAIANGCSEYLSKPVTRAKLLETINKYL